MIFGLSSCLDRSADEGRTSWQLRIYVGMDPERGRQRGATRTVRKRARRSRGAGSLCRRNFLRQGPRWERGISLGVLRLERWLVCTTTASSRGTVWVDASARGEDFYLATSGDHDLATRGDFFMATDTPAARDPSNETTCMRGAAVGAPGGGRG